SDVPFGVLLSGGVDSSMNVALMSELMPRPVTTFTIGYEGQESYNEFQFARRIATRYKTDHHEALINRQEMQTFLPLLVRLQDEPIADNVCIPLYFLAKLVRETGTTVVQVGEGADENFLGYWWCDHHLQKARSVYDPIRKNANRNWFQRLVGRSVANAFSSAEDLAFADGPKCPVDGLLHESHCGQDSHAVVRHYLSRLDGKLADPEVLQKIPYMEHQLRLPEHLLMRVDKLTMAHSIEARVPFLDHDIVEFATKLPPSYKLQHGVGKSLLKKAAAPYLDADIINRRNQGFGAPME